MPNSGIFREIKEALKDDPSSVSSEAFTRLVLEGIIGLHERIDAIPEVDIDVMKKLEKHEVTLYGTDSIKGHEARIKALEEKMTAILWVVAGIVTPLLVAIGLGIIRILQAQ